VSVGAGAGFNFVLPPDLRGADGLGADIHVLVYASRRQEVDARFKLALGSLAIISPAAPRIITALTIGDAVFLMAGFHRRRTRRLLESFVSL
jgi:hypothetical protein